jgi:hypothetical protein
LQNQNYSFVVRLWLEDTQDDRGPAIWRGSIEQVGSDRRIYFSGLDGIAPIIQARVGVSAAPSHFRWQQWSTIKIRFEQFWKHLFG